MYKPYSILLWTVVAFAVFSTLLLAYSFIVPPVPPSESFSPSVSLLQSSIYELEIHSLVLAPVGWTLVIGAWGWKGRVRSRWTRFGLGYDAFRLMARMRGGETRMKLLRSLQTPKDRFQLANELKLDWKTVDSHVRVLMNYGMIHEKTAYGPVKMYELSVMGNTVLHLMEDMNKMLPPETQ